MAPQSRLVGKVPRSRRKINQVNQVRYANFFLPPHYAKREREQVTIASQLGRQTHTAGKLVNIILIFFC